MKNSVLALTLALGGFWGISTLSYADNPAIVRLQQQHIQVEDLSFKNVMRSLYNGKMKRVFVNDEEVEQLPNVGLTEKNQDGENIIAVMHPVIQYMNIGVAPRYLVMIEKVSVSSEGSLVSCHACAATADFYIFKKAENGKFELVSRTLPKQEYSASYGRVNFDAEEFMKNIQPMGNRMVGSLYQSGYTSTGETELWWDAMLLSEDDYIGVYTVANAGGDNTGSYDEDSPLAYEYTSTYSILKNGKEYYPISIQYKGDHYTSDYKKIVPYNIKKTMTFNPQKRKYQ